MSASPEATQIPDVDKLHAAVVETFSMMVGMEARPDTSPEFLSSELTMTGVVHVTGEWSGSVLLIGDMPLCRKIAAEMFCMEDEEITIEEVGDAFGEMANMVGGSIKDMMGGKNNLSVPSVTTGTDYSVQVGHSIMLKWMSYSTDSGRIVVQIYQRVASKSSAASNRSPNV